MANKNIPNLPAATTPLANTEKFPLWDGTKTAWALVSAIGPALKSYFDSLTTTLTNKTLQHPVITDLLECNGSRIFGAQVLVMTALNTPQSFPSTGANSGILRIRDNTVGGGALYLVDPNGGVQLLGTSQIGGLTISNGGGGLGYIWQATITSGIIPRNLSWTMYG